MNKDEALRLALEVLADLGMKHYENTGEVLYKNTYTAIKAALEAKGEPDYSICPTCGGMADDPIVPREHRFQSVALEAKDEPMEFFDWYDNAHWGNEDFKEGCHRAWNAAIKYIAKQNQEAKDEPVAWRDAAIRLGEEMSSVGPDGYYDMDAKEWLDWAMEQNPRGKHSLPQRTWVGLTPEEEEEIITKAHNGAGWRFYIREAEAKLKEKNT